MGVEPTTSPLSGACLAATGYKSAALPVELRAPKGNAQRHIQNGFIAGIVLIITIILDWISHGLGSLAQEHTAILAATLLVLGTQTIFSSFLLSILGLRKT